VPDAVWNAAVAGGDATINLVASADVNANIGGNCSGESYVSVFVRANVAALECNGNRTPDSCEAAAVSINIFVADLLNGGVFSCYFDLNHDGLFDGNDIQHYVDAILVP
jgi:hypothetical protein